MLVKRRFEERPALSVAEQVEVAGLKLMVLLVLEFAIGLDLVMGNQIFHFQ